MSEFTKEQLERIETLDAGNVSVPQYKAMLKKVESASELHCIATGYNWDNGYDLLLNMVHHELCDKGTALEIYWLGQPGFYSGYKYKKDVPKHKLKGFSFLKKIEKLYVADNFSSNDIAYDPMSLHKEGLWQCLVKYSGVKDKMLIENTGDQEKSLKALKTIRKEPDDLQNSETLMFLSGTYYKNTNQFAEAYDCARRLYSIDKDDENYKSMYVYVMEEVDRQLKSEPPPASEIFTESEEKSFYRDFIQIQEEKLEALEKEIQSEDRVDEQKAWNLRHTKKSIAKLHLSVDNDEAAIKILDQLVDDAQSDNSIRDKQLCHINLAVLHQKAGDIESAEYNIDEILKERDEFGGSHYLPAICDLLDKMGKSEKVDTLLVEEVDVSRKVAERIGEPTTEVHIAQARLLEFRKDYNGAAEVLQELIDKKIFTSNELLERIANLKQGQATPSNIPPVTLA